MSENGADLVDAVKAATDGKLAYAAIECVGGDMFAAVASSVRNGGTAIIYGAMSGLGASFSIPDPLFRGVTIRGYWVAHELHTWVLGCGCWAPICARAASSDWRCAL